MLVEFDDLLVKLSIKQWGASLIGRDVVPVEVDDESRRLLAATHQNHFEIARSWRMILADFRPVNPGDATEYEALIQELDEFLVLVQHAAKNILKRPAQLATSNLAIQHETAE